MSCPKFAIKALGLCLVLVFPNIAQALSCSGFLPMLSPYRANHTIIDATAIRTIDTGAPYPSVELHVSQVFRGELASDTIVVEFSDIDPQPSIIPIGSRNVMAVGGPHASGYYGVDNICAATLSIVAGQVQGLIRGYDCPDHRNAWSVHQCDMPHESMPITEFAELLTNYYAGVQQAVSTCQSHQLPGCEDTRATFSFEDNRLSLPVVVLEHKQPVFSPPVATGQINNIVMQLMGAEDGNLLFKLLP